MSKFREKLISSVELANKIIDGKSDKLEKLLEQPDDSDEHWMKLCKINKSINQWTIYRDCLKSATLNNINIITDKTIQDRSKHNVGRLPTVTRHKPTGGFRQYNRGILYL